MKKIAEKIKEKLQKILHSRIFFRNYFKNPSDGAFFVLFFGALVLFLLSATGIFNNRPNTVTPTQTVETIGIPTATTTPNKTKLPAKQTSSTSRTPPQSPEPKSVYVYDMTDNKVLFEKDSNLLLPLASMTKVMTAIVALQYLGANSEVTITKDALDIDGDSGLKLGEKWKVGDLVKFMLVVSSNDGAHALALEAANQGLNFTGLMNDKAKEIGLAETFFINETGLDETADTGGSYGTAQDIAKLLAYGVKNYREFFEPTEFKEYTITSDSGIKHIATNTSEEVTTVKNVVASKTGYTDLAGGNLVFIFDPKPGHDIAIALFGTDREGRFTAAAKYANLATSELSK